MPRVTGHSSVSGQGAPKERARAIAAFLESCSKLWEVPGEQPPLNHDLQTNTEVLEENPLQPPLDHERIIGEDTLLELRVLNTLPVPTHTAGIQSLNVQINFSVLQSGFC